FEEGYHLSGSSFVVNKYLNDTWLWDKVRVQGGAYGGFAVFDIQSGVFGFLSYRDPNLAETLHAYDQSSDYLKSLEVDEAELTKAIIGTIGDLDTYLLPDAKGFTAMRWFLTGTTDAERQRLRDEVLSTSSDNFHKFGQILEKIKDHAAVVVLGVDEAIRAAGIFDDIKKVM
ncbi:MAG TPA: peptidase M16, partial [Anaerolineales bacterium]